MSRKREGGCACEALRYRLAAEPMFIHRCHCLNCQRQTGSAFVINLLVEAAHVEVVAGTAHPVEVPRDDGSMQRIFRCPRCQVAIFSEYGAPEVRFVRAGTLDDPTDIAPDVHIFTRSKVGWVTVPHGRPAFEVYYDSEKVWPAESLRRLNKFCPARSEPAPGRPAAATEVSLSPRCRSRGQERQRQVAGWSWARVL